MNYQLIRETTAGRFVRVLSAHPPYEAFIPKPLPPSLEFDRDLLWLLSEADQSIGRLSALGKVSLINPALLIRPFIRREAVSSSRIEGTEAELEELYAYEVGQLTLPGLGSPERIREVREVYNYVRALEYGVERLNEIPVSLRLIKELHKVLLEGVRGGEYLLGEFRDRQNWIGSPGASIIEAEFVPPPVEVMKECLYELENYIHHGNRLPKLVRVALVHYQFEAIHPFIDGNGRVGRLLIILLLLQWGVLSKPLLYLSSFFEANRDEYLDRLLGVSERGEWHEWISFFLRGVLSQSEAAVETANRLFDLHEELRRRFQAQARRGSVALLGLIDLMFESPVVVPTEVAERLGVSHPTVMKCIRRLEEEGILVETTGQRRNRAYLARPVLDVLNESKLT